MSNLDPKKLRTMGVLRWVLVALSIFLAVGSWWTYLRAAGPEGSAASQPKYQCPMHPAIVSNVAGTCPICGMDLEPISKARAEAPPMATTHAPYTLEDAGAATMGDGGAARFFCPMHPEIKSADPGNCPLCKMKLEPIPASAPPPGLAPVTLTLDRQQAIGVRTAVATLKDASGTTRATATIAAPEQGAAEVHVRTPGFVERVAVKETGARVSAGQELFAMYSPEIWQAEAELLASRSIISFGDAGLGDRATNAARQKLEILGMSPRAIDQVVESGKPLRAISVVAPAGGWVTKKNVVLGSYVTPETALYEIVDLSRVYVIVDVFDDVLVGTKGKLSIAGHPDLDTTATVDLVYPRVNPEARTSRVRMQIPNDKMRFLPGQYGTVRFEGTAHRAVFVPRDAVIDTGEARYVFVDEGQGRLVPRAVVLGASQADEIEIAKGVSAGERVVSGATFLVDSESRLRAALAASQHQGHTP
jgi:membrane fusion protein, copper/silver efflux system